MPSFDRLGWCSAPTQALARKRISNVETAIGLFAFAASPDEDRVRFDLPQSGHR
jgi:hypothetical protein